MNKEHKLTVHREISEDEFGDIEIEFGMSIKYEDLTHMGTHQLYDEIFDHINALMKEACARQAIHRKKIYPS